ncbi:hypothetical protein PROVRETT_07924 [Providencia rettgeri DSM 1131]|nr:hypothetical protein PROVRETT_07924 [Providencia rettgeri DSM 1131]BBV03694.1 hypothetical protein BML2531_14700 [Providencia rettgeri]
MDVENYCTLRLFFNLPVIHDFLVSFLISLLTFVFAEYMSAFNTPVFAADDDLPAIF